MIGLEPATPEAVGFPEWVIKFYPKSSDLDLKAKDSSSLEILKIVYKTHEHFSTLNRDQLARFVKRQFMESELIRLGRKARAVGGSFPGALTQAKNYENELNQFIEKELVQLEFDLANDKVRQLVSEANAAVFAGLRKLSQATDSDLHSPISLFTEEAEACRLGGAPFQLFTYF